MAISKVNNMFSQLTKDLIPRLKSKDTSKTNTSEEDTLEDTSKGSDAAPPRDETMKCKIKHLDRRYDSRDEQYYAERKEEVKKPMQKDWWRLFAFCLVKEYDDDGDLEETRLYVNHPPLRQFLFDVIGDYPDDPIDVNDVRIQDPYWSLFYYRKELETKGFDRFQGDKESTAQLRLLIGWIKTHFEQDIAAYEKCVIGGLRAISYDQLWTLFPPGKILYAKVQGQHRGFRVNSCWYETDPDQFSLRTDFIDFDGERLGTRREQMLIDKYSGTRQLRELAAMPLDLVEKKGDGDSANDSIRAAMIARGRKFEEYVGQYFGQYDGVALQKTEHEYVRINVQGRIMIDCATYHRLEPKDAFEVKELQGNDTTLAGIRKPMKGQRVAVDDINIAPETKTLAKLSDDDAVITNSTVPGYAFSLKQFLLFFVNDVAPIEWNQHCFDDLVLNPATKKTVQAVVSMHSNNQDRFDDIVKGKGQGLVCVLHGPPGVGKTLTAECVAEYVKRPLYMVSSGDLGVAGKRIDEALARIVDLASTWKAILLIDEADVFLEKRQSNDVYRNALVSVFLRALEYYSGILFLTTNRVQTFDEGFKSRIHIPIQYTNLNFASRLQIWRTLCARVPGGVDVDEAALKDLTSLDFNGRQIKNIIKAAESLAAFDGVRVDYAQLQQVTKIQGMFERDMTNLSGINYDAPGESKKGDEQYMYT